jgi:hypothetical protein
MDKLFECVLMPEEGRVWLSVIRKQVLQVVVPDVSNRLAENLIQLYLMVMNTSTIFVH